MQVNAVKCIEIKVCIYLYSIYKFKKVTRWYAVRMFVCSAVRVFVKQIVASFSSL